eukprot:9468961-Pyramimonas_sp.AAC.1
MLVAFPRSPVGNSRLHRHAPNARPRTLSFAPPLHLPMPLLVAVPFGFLDIRNLRTLKVGTPGHWSTLARTGRTEVLTAHPAFRGIPGVTHRTLCIDVLHTLDLG